MTARNEQIRAAIASGMSLREIEAATGIPRSTVQRIGATKPLTEAKYLRLANSEAVARAEVVALESVEATLIGPSDRNARSETLPEPEVDEVMELVGFMLRLRPLIEKDREE